MAKIENLIKYINFIDERHKAFGGLIYLGNAAEKYIEKSLASYNMPVNVYRVLRGLRNAYPEGVGVYKLRDFLIDQKSDVSRLSQRMVVRGLVKRTKNLDNKSITQVILTTKGFDLVNEIDEHMKEFYAPMTCLSDEEAKQLNHLFGKILDSFLSTESKLSAHARPQTS